MKETIVLKPAKGVWPEVNVVVVLGALAMNIEVLELNLKQLAGSSAGQVVRLGTLLQLFSLNGPGSKKPLAWTGAD